MTDNFPYSELIRSEYAIKHDIDNTPSKAICKNLLFTANNLEIIREKLGGHKIIISSGFRNTQVNRGVNGSYTSDHMTGFAVDIKVQNGKSTQDTAVEIARMGIQFDQLIIYNSFIHISFNPRYRNQIHYNVKLYASI